MSGEVFGTGKVQQTAKQQEVPYLGKIELSPVISKASDEGKPFILTQTKEAEEFNKIIQKIKASVN